MKTGQTFTTRDYMAGYRAGSGLRQGDRTQEDAAEWFKAWEKRFPWLTSSGSQAEADFVRGYFDAP